MQSDNLFDATWRSRTQALAQLATLALFAAAALELLNSLELFIAWLADMQRPLAPGGHLPGKLRLGACACALASVGVWLQVRHELWVSDWDTDHDLAYHLRQLARFPLRVLTAPSWLRRNPGDNAGGAAPSVPLLLLGLCWAALPAGWAFFAYFDLTRPLAEVPARRIEFWLTNLGLTTFLLTALAIRSIQRRSEEARVHEAVQARIEATAAPFFPPSPASKPQAPSPIEIDPSWRVGPSSFPVSPGPVPEGEIEIDLDDGPLELDSAPLSAAVPSAQATGWPPVSAAPEPAPEAEAVAAPAVAAALLPAATRAAAAPRGARRSFPARLVAAHRVGGALMLLTGAANLVAASQGSLDQSFATGVSVASVVDLVLGALLLAGSRPALTLSRARAVLGIAGMLVTAVVTKDLVQTALYGCGVATLLALLCGEPDRARTWLGAGAAAASLTLVLLGAFAAITGDALLARPVLRLRGQIGAEPAVALRGSRIDYHCELPPDRWFALSEPPVKEELPSDNWLVLPRYGAHLVAYVHHVPGAGGIDLAALEKRTGEQRQKTPGFRILGAERMEGPFDEARWTRFEEGREGERIESLMAMFSQGDYAFVLIGSAPQRNFPLVEPDLRRAIDSFRYTPVPKPTLAESALAQVRAATTLVLTESGSGSGFVLGTTSEGLVLATNAHVARPGGNGEKVYVVFGTGSRPLPRRATVLASDPDRDLALLAVDDPEVRAKALPLRKSAGLPVGSPTFVAGFPLGLSLAGYGAYPSVTFASGRIAERPAAAPAPKRDELTIDAGINPGNSGGPVVDAEGAVLGVATAHVVASETSFVVPSETLAQFVAEKAPSLGLLWNDWEPPASAAPAAAMGAEARERATAATVLVRVGKHSGAGILIRAGDRRLVATSYDLTHDGSGRLRATPRLSADPASEAEPVDARVLLASPAASITLLDGSLLEDLPALELGKARALPETSALEVFGFRTRAGAASVRQTRTALLLARQFDRARSLSRLQFDVGTSRGFTGGPVVDAQGTLAAFALPVPAGENLAEAVPAEVVAELLRGSVRGGAVRYLADGMDRCYLELYVELDDPLGAVEAISVAFQAPAEEAWLAGNPAAFPVGAPVSRIERSPMNVLKLQPEHCPTFFGFQIFLEDAQGRRSEGPRRLVLPATGPTPRSFDFAGSVDDRQRIDSRAFLQLPFLPPAGWTPGCPVDRPEQCAQRCSRQGGASCYTFARGRSPHDPEARQAMRRACQDKVAVACTDYAEMLGVDAEVETWQRLGCDGGDGRACERLGRARLDYDPPLALEFFRRGCSLRDGESCLSAGRLRQQGTGGEPDLQVAREFFTRGCQLWSEEACFSLAEFVVQGEGLNPDPAVAYDLFERACAGGHPASCRRTGEMNVSGQGTPRAPLLGHFFLDRGCRLGDSQACRRRAELERDQDWRVD